MVRPSKEELPLKKNPSRKSKKIRLTTVIQTSNEEKFKMLKEKNRESAQRSRDNKKKYVVGLENRISELVLENDYLRKQLSLCHCNRPEQPSVDNNITTNASSGEEEKIIDEEAEPSFYQRISVKSFTSCSNFLLLSLVVLFCVFGYVDVTGDTARPPTGFYSVSSLETALIHWNGVEPSCENPEVPRPPNPLRYAGLEKADAMRNGIRPAPNQTQSIIKALVEEQLHKNMTVVG